MNLAFHRVSYRRPALMVGEAPQAFLAISAALTCHKGNASQAQSSIQNGAQDQGVTASGNNSTTKAATGSNAKIFDVTLPAGSTTSGGGSVLSNTESGGVSLNGQGNSVSYTDNGAVDSALKLVKDVTAAAADQQTEVFQKLSDLTEQKIQDASTQKAQLTFAAVAGLTVLGGVYLVTRTRSK